MYTKILEGVKVICLCAFVWIIYDISLTVKHTSQELVLIAKETKNETLQEVTSIRKDTFSFLDRTTNKIENRLSSVEAKTFNRLDSIEDNLFAEVRLARKDLNSQLTVTNNTVKNLAEEYSTLPKEIRLIASRLEEQTNCEINELCWQNMTTDLLIDTRNVVRDGSKTFRIINNSVPKLVEDSTKVSSAVATNLPIVTKNVAETSDHIRRITKPRWYDKFITYGLSGALLYVTASKP